MDTLKVVLNKFVSHFRPHYSSTKQEVKSKGVLMMEPIYHGQERQKRDLISATSAISCWFVNTLNDSEMFCIAYTKSNLKQSH